MNYLLDTNACIAYLNRLDSSVRNHMQLLKPSQIVLCTVVEAELYYGVMKSANPVKNLERLLPFVRQFISLPFTRLQPKNMGGSGPN